MVDLKELRKIFNPHLIRENKLEDSKFGLRFRVNRVKNFEYIEIKKNKKVFHLSKSGRFEDWEKFLSLKLLEKLEGNSRWN